MNQLQIYQPTEYVFSDEKELPAATKRQLLSDWQRFIHSGFKFHCFSGELYRWLGRFTGFIAHTNQATFWGYYFDGPLVRLRLFLNQFGGNFQSAEYGTDAWLDGPAADLKAAMCREMSLVYGAMSQVLQDLEYKHEELGRVWFEFALAAGLQPAAWPNQYLVSENTRNLLAYAAGIAHQQQRRPLYGLQTQFLTPLLYGHATDPQFSPPPGVSIAT